MRASTDCGQEQAEGVNYYRGGCKCYSLLQICAVDKAVKLFNKVRRVCLIPKGGDQHKIRQWCPITLLSTAYKILAKMISARVHPLLSNLIHDTQIGFI